MNRCVAIAAIIVVASTAAASAAVLGTMIKIALITSSPPMKYWNHWPSPIFSNVGRFIAPACLVAPAIRNAAAARDCSTQNVMLSAFECRLCCA